jgi:hypothetical protein
MNTIVVNVVGDSHLVYLFSRIQFGYIGIHGVHFIAHPLSPPPNNDTYCRHEKDGNSREKQPSQVVNIVWRHYYPPDFSQHFLVFLPAIIFLPFFGLRGGRGAIAFFTLYPLPFFWGMMCSFTNEQAR